MNNREFKQYAAARAIRYKVGDMYYAFPTIWSILKSPVQFYREFNRLKFRYEIHRGLSHED